MGDIIYSSKMTISGSVATLSVPKPAIQIEEYSDFVERTDIRGDEGNISSAIRKIKQQLKKQKSFNVFADFFGFLRRYSEGVSDITGVSLRKTVNSNGCLALSLDHKGVLNSDGDISILTLFSMVELDTSDNANEISLMSEHAIVPGHELEVKIARFEENMEVYEKSYNTLFLGNTSLLILQQYRHLVQKLIDAGSLCDCFVAVDEPTGDVFTDKHVLSCIYKRYCEDRGFSVYIRASLIMKAVCFQKKHNIH